MKILPYPVDPRYRVSDQGDVWGVHGRLLKGELHETKPGCVYRRIMMSNTCRPYVHDMVLRTFKGPKPKGLTARHMNGDSLDNRLRNLRYGTYHWNNMDRVRHGRHPNANKTECVRGHEFTSENTYINPVSGSRQCRKCVNINKRARTAARKSRLGK